MGDFNYRIGLSHEKAMDLVKQQDLEKLYENDQVNQHIRIDDVPRSRLIVESANGRWPFFPVLFRSWDQLYAHL